MEGITFLFNPFIGPLDIIYSGKIVETGRLKPEPRDF